MLVHVARRITGFIFLGCLIGLLLFFYSFTPDSFQGSKLLFAYLLAVSVDALLLLLHLVRRSPPPKAGALDPSKFSIFIASYNGEDVLASTLSDALKLVPADQIIVVSDNSQDHTADIARSFGVRVYENKRNYGKSMTINRHIHRVTTPYVLILDDDTLVGQTFVPTSLLDEGYAAVAFNVRPVPTGSLANYFQQFEYRKSMILRKGLRASGGTVGNVSGAMGLYHTRDLIVQSRRHSGQSGGEDQQRTNLTHIDSRWQGVTYCASPVYTHAPDSLGAVFKQRAFKWNTAMHENFVLMLRIIMHKDTKPMLKVEKTYALYVLLSEPFRIVFFFMILIAPFGSLLVHLSILWGFYIIIELTAWLKLRRKDPLWVALLFPLYAKFTSIARFVAHFYWLKKKYVYSFKNRFHRLVSQRRLLAEYGALLAILTVLWSVAIFKLSRLLSTPEAVAKLHQLAPQWDISTLGGDLRVWMIVMAVLAVTLPIYVIKQVGGRHSQQRGITPGRTAQWVPHSVRIEKDERAVIKF